MAINETALNQLLERALVDIGGTYHTVLAVIGDKLGLYKALAGSEPQTELLRLYENGWGIPRLRDASAAEAAIGRFFSPR